MARIIQNYGDGREIWFVPDEFGGSYYVYGVYRSGPSICPTESMARDVAGSAL